MMNQAMMGQQMASGAAQAQLAERMAAQQQLGALQGQMQAGSMGLMQQQLAFEDARRRGMMAAVGGAAGMEQAGYGATMSAEDAAMKAAIAQQQFQAQDYMNKQRMQLGIEQANAGAQNAFTGGLMETGGKIGAAYMGMPAAAPQGPQRQQQQAVDPNTQMWADYMGAP